MKKEELLEIFKIERVGFGEIIKDIKERLQTGLNFIPVLVIYLLLNTLSNTIPGQISSNYAWIIMLFTFFYSLILIAYIMLTIESSESFVFTRERLEKTGHTLFPQIKTMLALFVYSIPFILVSALIAVAVIFAIFSVRGITPEPENMMNYMIFIFIVLTIVLSRFMYSTYIAILHKTSGFDAVKLSALIYRENILITTLLYIVMLGAPMLVRLALASFELTMINEISLNILGSFISFLVIVFSAFFLKRAVKRDAKN